MAQLSASISTSQDTELSALSEPPSSASASAMSSDDFFTPASELGSCSGTMKDGDAHGGLDYQRSLSSDPRLPYPVVYFNSKAEIEASKVHWTPRADSEEQEELETETERLEVFRSLRREWGGFFMEFDDQFKMGPKIAEGGQAEIFEVVSCKSKVDLVVKLFKKGASLRDLQNQWPEGMLQTFSSKHGGPNFNHYSVNLHGAMLLDGRFAFLMQRYWGDLRTLIDIKMIQNPVKGPIFTDSRVFHNMLEIADGMRDLHKAGILHRDLKASNVLIRPFESRFDPIYGYFFCKVSDYECSVGVVGTGFWRAPEILSCLLNAYSDRSSLCTQQSDVYSYGMIMRFSLAICLSVILHEVIMISFVAVDDLSCQNISNLG